jgi:hypothetical protein
MTLAGYQQQERGTHAHTGKPVRCPHTLLLACAAVERGIEPIS